jgi:hypothetical protein
MTEIELLTAIVDLLKITIGVNLAIIFAVTWRG